MKILITCEHGGNTIPKKYAGCFKENIAVLKTHRGYDLGALDVYNALTSLSNYSAYCTTSRLLIELNRSLHHKNLFSEFTKPLSFDIKKELIDNYYTPYRTIVEKYINKNIAIKNEVLHLSIHSFTPTLNTIERNCDIGLLYDPKNQKEKKFCKTLKSNLTLAKPDLKIRFNYPYLGTADGFTSYLRKKFPANYIGIELEINQKYSYKNKMDNSIKVILQKAILETLEK